MGTQQCSVPGDGHLQLTACLCSLQPGHHLAPTALPGPRAAQGCRTSFALSLDPGLCRVIVSNDSTGASVENCSVSAYILCQKEYTRRWRLLRYVLLSWTLNQRWLVGGCGLPPVGEKAFGRTNIPRQGTQKTLCCLPPCTLAQTGICGWRYKNTHVRTSCLVGCIDHQTHS